MSLLTAYQNITRVSLEKKNFERAIVREKLSKFRYEVNSNRQTGRDPLLIFPAEIWALTLEYLTTATDRSSASQTCQLFKRLVNQTKVELLFCKIFPLIHRNIWAGDILRCRKVCRMWHSGVTSYFENYHRIRPISRDIVDQLKVNGKNKKDTIKEFDFVHCPKDPEPDEYNENRDIPVKPFLGGTLYVQLDHDSREFVSNFRDLLVTNGQRILCLVLDGKHFEKRFAFVSQAVLDSLRNCRNLQSFTLRSWNCKRWSVGRNFDLPFGFGHNLDLESFTVEVKHRQFLQIQDQILAKYSSQLKHLSVHFWNAELYQNFNWGNLLELEILLENCSHLLENLTKINAPNLQKLVIRLDKSNPQLVNLISMLNHFPSLNHLCLQMSLNFPGFSNKQIQSTSQGAVSLASISTLDFITKNKEFCFDFLICFPVLKRLVIKTGGDSERDYLFVDSTQMAESQHSESDTDDDDDNDDAYLDRSDQQEIRKATFSPEVRDVSQDLIHLSNFLPTGSFVSQSLSQFGELHKSNIWTLVPSLQEINICYVDDDSYERVTVYSRDLYEWRITERREWVQTQLSWVQKRLANQKRWKRDEEKKRLQILRLSVTPNSKGKHPLQLLPDKNWAMILSYVSDNKDILSCVRACPMFREFFSDTKTKWLFSKIFPMIYVHLDKSDVLICRLVCKTWLDGTDEYLANYFCTKTWSLENDDPLPRFDYSRIKEYQRDLQSAYKFHNSDINPKVHVDSHEHVREKMNLHPSNPFIGRTVTFLPEENFQDDESLKWSFDVFDDFGHHIWHARLHDKETFSVENGQLLYGSRSRLTLEMCPNLRSLCIADLRVDYDGSPSLQKIIHETLSDGFKFPKMPYLESVIIEKYDVHEDFILHKLVRYYDRQLKRVQVPWYPGGNWMRLEEFICSAPSTDQWLERLDRLHAPNLVILELRLDGVKPKLRELLKGIYARSKLQELRLKFAEEFAGFSKEEVVKIMTFHPKLMAPPSLAQLEITTTDKNMSYEFLFFFPYLKTLTIRHGEGTRFWYGMETYEGSEDGSSDAGEETEDVEELDDNSGDGEASDGEEEEEEEEIEVLGPDLESDYIQIAKYIEDSGEIKCCRGIYASKVWQVLPYLGQLKVEYVKGDGSNKEENILFAYTRDGLERFLNRRKV